MRYNNHMINLNGIVALVTGATRGVGKGVARELADAGATVYATDRTTAEETLTTIMEKSGQVLVVAALAQEYGFTDIDGRLPHPVMFEKA
jgi:NAD(P)-dependent dehydrogenase (short-subunit alcohol dehydrogenase family)